MVSQDFKFPIIWLANAMRHEKAYLMYQNQAGYHLLQHMSNSYQKGYTIFWRSYHIDETI